MDNETTLPQSLLLPHDIEEEILSRLPVKSLLRFKCVSKPWHSLIESFVKKHLQNYSNNKTYEDRRRVIMHCFTHGLNQHGPNSSSLRSYHNESFLDLTRINDPKNKHLMSGVVLDSCNGLFCIYKFKLPWAWGLFFWNPATRVSIKLPKPDLPNIDPKMGVWFGGRKWCLQVFVVMSDRYDQGIGRVYSSKTNSWKRAEQIGNLSSLCDGNGIVAHGKIHWLVKSGHIETFDLKNEVFGTMDLSNEVLGMMKLCVSIKDNFLYLWESMGFLKVVWRNNKDNGSVSFRVWVMEEYGDKESWVEE